MTLKLSWVIHPYKRFFGALENIWFIDRKSKAKIGAHKNETQHAIGTTLTYDLHFCPKQHINKGQSSTKVVVLIYSSPTH